MKNIKFITLHELLASVKEDLSSFDNMGLIDEGRVIKTVMWCNERLGIPIHQIREKFIKVRDYKADLPQNFWKVTFVCAIDETSFCLTGYRDPWNNTTTLEDRAKAEAEMCTYVEGCTTKCSPLIIRRENNIEVFRYTHWTSLSLSKSSNMFADKMCFNRPGGKYTIDIDEEQITLPFREGELYMMYLSTMEDEDGNVLVPFHPLITNWYEWCVKEKILQDILFNSDADVANKLKLAQEEKGKNWLDAWNFQMEPEYRQLQQYQKQLEANYYNKYFKLDFYG